jgi:hypothetical protein
VLRAIFLAGTKPDAIRMCFMASLRRDCPGALG